MVAFIEEHRVFLWKEIACQSGSPEHFVFSLNTGALLWDPIAWHYTSVLNQAPEQIVAMPHFIGVTREIERNRQGRWSGNWVGTLFGYQPPVIGFSGGEQRLLSHAVSGFTDAQLAETLGISVPAVKKSRVSIYRRVGNHLAELFGDAAQPEDQSTGRGREKRRRVLAYLRDHPEELRQYSRKLVGESKAPRAVRQTWFHTDG